MSYRISRYALTVVRFNEIQPERIYSQRAPSHSCPPLQLHVCVASSGRNVAFSFVRYVFQFLCSPIQLTKTCNLHVLESIFHTVSGRTCGGQRISRDRYFFFKTKVKVMSRIILFQKALRSLLVLMVANCRSF